MPYHEYYGDLPAALLRDIKRYNVSPADYWFLEDLGGTHETIHAHILRNVSGGYYSPSWPLAL